MTARRSRGHKQILDDLKERRGYWEMKEEALDRTLLRTCYARGYGPVVRHTKGKTISLQAWTGSEGSRSLRLPDFKTIGT